MALDAGTGVVRIIADTSKLSAEVAAGTQKATSGLSAFATKVQTAITSPLGLASIALAGFAASSVKSFEEHVAVMAQLRVAVGENTQAFEDQATALQNLTGFQDEEVLAADTVLARFQLTSAQIQDLIPHVLDYARATGQDAATAAGSLGKALLGNTRALKAIGIDFKATGDRAKDLATITKALQDRVGGASKAFGETFSGKLEILSARFDDLKEVIGGEIVPVLTDLADIVGALASQRLPSLTSALDLLVSTSALLPPPLREAVEAYQSLHDLIASDTSIAASQQTVERWAASIVAGTFSVDELRDKLTDLGASTENVNKIVGRVQDGVKGLTEANIASANAATDAASAFRDQLAAQRALANQAAGLIGAVLNLKSAQRELHAAQGDSSTSAAELKSRELDVVNAMLAVNGSFGDLIERMREGKASSADVIDKFIAVAQKAGLSANQIEDLTSVIQAYIDRLNAIPAFVSTNITATGPGNFRTMASGGIVTHPTMALIGESGPEAVVPLSRHGSAGLGPTIVINAGTLVHQNELPGFLRDALLELKRRNVTTGI